MKYVQKEFSYIYEEKKSKFISYLVPYSMFDSKMNELKKEHPKARHFVYAYRYLNEFDQIVENSSDDGEPRGTSGKPCLNVLAGNELINSAVIVIRYFGGVKLGTGGLVRAYSSSVNSCIDLSTFNIYEKQIIKKIECEYSDLQKLEYLLQECKIDITEKIFNDKVQVHLSSSNKKYEELNKKLPINIELVLF